MSVFSWQIRIRLKTVTICLRKLDVIFDRVAMFSLAGICRDSMCDGSSHSAVLECARCTEREFIKIVSERPCISMDLQSPASSLTSFTWRCIFPSDSPIVLCFYKTMDAILHQSLLLLKHCSRGLFLGLEASLDLTLQPRPEHLEQI